MSSTIEPKRKKFDGPLVVACGAGTNSVAVLIRFAKIKQHVDLITFADTKGEKPETYAFLEVFDKWCKANGLPAITVLRAESPKPERGFEGLEGMCLRLSTMPSKVFGYKTCSQRYKIEPQQQFVGKWPPATFAWANGCKVTQVIGYDAGEPHRAKTYTNEKYDHWYPLIEWGWERNQCIAEIARAGLPLPGKSACFFCPSAKKQEVLALAESHPDLYRRAVEMEQRAITGGRVTTVKGLGRYWSWAELVQIKNADELPEPTEIDCACYDGE